MPMPDVLTIGQPPDLIRLLSPSNCNCSTCFAPVLAGNSATARKVGIDPRAWWCAVLLLGLPDDLQNYTCDAWVQDT